MTLDATIPLWGVLMVFGAVAAKFLDRYCVEIAEKLVKSVSQALGTGLSQEARLLWQRELLFHALERISNDLNAGRVRREVAWTAVRDAIDMVLAAPSLRTDYARRAKAGESADDARLGTAQPRLGSMRQAVASQFQQLRIVSPLIMLISIIGLFLVLIPGVGSDRHGATRWIGAGSLAVQPADFAKLAVALYVPAWLSGRGDNVKAFWQGFFPCVLLVGFVCGIVLLEPGLDSAVIIAFTVMSIAFVAGASLRHMVAFSGTASAVALLLVAAGNYRVPAPYAAWDASAIAYLGLILLVCVAVAIPVVFFRLRFGRRLPREAFGSLAPIAIMFWIWYEIMFNIGWATHFVPNDAVDPQLSLTRLSNVVLMSVGALIAGGLALSPLAMRRSAGFESPSGPAHWSDDSAD
jgi:hypothetical protein